MLNIRKLFTRQILVIIFVMSIFSLVIAGIGLLFYQGMAAFDNDLGIDNDLVFLVPKDRQKQDILETLIRIESDLQNVEVITDADLNTLDSIDQLLQLDFDFLQEDPLLDI